MTPAGNKVRVTVSLDIDVHRAVESGRGLIPFSTFLNDLLREHYSLK